MRLKSVSRLLGSATACVAAAVLVSACGGQSSAFGGTSTSRSLGVPSSGITTSTAGVGDIKSKTSGVPMDRLVGPEGVNFEANPVLAPAPSNLTGAPISGVQCQTLVQLAYQSNSHLQVYVDGIPEALPGGIGMMRPSPNEAQAGQMLKASRCYYWLHTLTQDGVIHVASPVPRQFTLGQLFAVWGQPLSSTRVATASGPVTATVDGHRWHGDPSLIPLTEHSTIELAVGTPVPTFKPIDWSTSGL